ncbi:MAG: T9SS C-terminal target domain-containing protein [Calditrichaeota bacterium]|nr:MAG: T9SS C-terminal target domain-containing protein [Calditrichota bacterium]MBL1206722.1 T9SS C-terminal target domain-containing protein [Calditrichota bacterium]NOG46548.1 T9SS type A sorting domain-containing protein [Calditrichota bacterium]
MQHSILKFFILLFFSLTSIISAQTFSGPTNLDEIAEESTSVSFADYNHDGWVDLFLSRGNASDGTSYDNVLFSNSSGTFSDASLSVITATQRTSGTATWGDYDNDGNIDLYVANAEPGFNGGEPPNNLFINDGAGDFTNNTTFGDIVDDSDDSRVVGWGDYNNDGFIDLYQKRGNIFFTGEIAQTNIFFRNDAGSGSTRNPSGIGDIITSGGTIDGINNAYSNLTGAMVWGDYNGDGYMDIYTARGSTKLNTLWKNNGSGAFVDDTPATLRPTQTSTQACSWGDWDNDGDLDLYTGTKPEAGTKHSFIFENTSTTSTTSFSDATAGDISTDEYYVRGSAWADVDNDGDLDLFTSTMSDAVFENPASRLYVNSGTPNYTLTMSSTFSLDDGTNTSNGRGVAFADIDNDGDQDFVVGRFYKPLLYTNTTSNGNSFANIKLVGTTKNISAIGTQIHLFANIPEQTSTTEQMREISSQSGAGSQSDMRAHFGLGTTSKIDSIQVNWLNTSGGAARTRTTYTDMPVGKFMVFTQSGSASVIKQQAFMYLIGNTGAAVEFETNTDTDGGSLSISRTDSDPGDAGFSGSATSPDASTITPNVVSPAKYWTISETGLTGNFTAEVYIDITGVSGISDADKLVILRRANSGAAWNPINTERIGNTLYSSANLSSFSEFGIGSNSADNSLPVELTSFTAVAGNNSIELNWETASELNNLGYILERTTKQNNTFAEISSYKDNSALAGQGNSSTVNNYSYVDNNVVNGENYLYRLSDISMSGVRTYHSVIEASANQIVTGFKLLPNFPNPFNPETTLRFEIPAEKAYTKISLAVYNAAGELVTEIYSGELSSGVHEFKWSGTNMTGQQQASGIYFARFSAGKFVQTRKLILLK